jgi:hypothetical protein
MEAASYPAWAQRLIQDCSESKRRVVEHELYQRMRDNTLSAKTMRQYLIGGWPVVEQFALYMAQNLTKTRFARHPGEDMARRWLMRNIRVELNHADYWVNWSRAHGVTLKICRRNKCRLNCTPEPLVLAHQFGGFADRGHCRHQLRHRRRDRGVVGAGLFQWRLCGAFPRKSASGR